MLVALRRRLYRRGLLPRQRLPVAVVIVGNICVGGTGKTPLVIHLAQALRRLGRRPGIVSRGYRGAAAEVSEIGAASDPAVAGDEPVLLARRSGCPVFVGRDRPAAARALLARHPECDVILADDGLQHYRLARDVEIAMFDERGVMNGWPLPAGPLREPLERLNETDAVVLCRGAVTCPQSGIPGTQRVPTATSAAVFSMRLRGDSFYRLDDPSAIRGAGEFAGETLHAVAGIGTPQRFFDQLAELGLRFSAHAFADHHRYAADDLAFAGGAILTTEKDAVKLARLHSALPIWVLPVTAEVNPDLAAFVLEKINGYAPA